jgi:hypothetical protein
MSISIMKNTVFTDADSINVVNHVIPHSHTNSYLHQHKYHTEFITASSIIPHRTRNPQPRQSKDNQDSTIMYVAEKAFAYMQPLEKGLVLESDHVGRHELLHSAMRLARSGRTS